MDGTPGVREELNSLTVTMTQIPHLDPFIFGQRRSAVGREAGDLTGTPNVVKRVATILWDFDGTLATRPGLWSQAMVDVLDRYAPGHDFDRNHFRPVLRDGFPWHRHEQPHPHLNDPEAWWEEINRLIAAAFTSVGLSTDDVIALTANFREVFLDPAAWVIYDDTEDALTRLSSHGWRHVIVSNHVPELPRLVTNLGLANHFEDIVTSAAVGYEKPHPEIFRLATSGLVLSDVVMVGDNPIADVVGARAAGIKTFLVRRRDEDVAHYADLYELVAALVDASPHGA
ncbi:MAG: HAD-IA family hydrolase [Acidimicrobiia bacterium]|jgi:putative hydrolase of the HAD superfamily